MPTERDDAPLTPIERALVRAVVAALVRPPAPALEVVVCR